MDPPEDNFMLAVAVILKIFHTIVREITVLASVNNANVTQTEVGVKISATNTNDRNAGIAMLFFFSVLCFLPLLTSFIVFIIHISTHYKNKEVGKEHHSPVVTLLTCRSIYKSKSLKHSHASFFACLIQSIVLTLYFYGDNLGYILQRYGEAIGCDKKCIEINHTIARAILVIAALLLHIFPLLLKQLVQKYNWKYKQEDWYKAFGIFGVIVKVESAYTTFAIIAQTSAYCSPTELTLGSIFLFVCSIVGIIAIVKKVISMHDCTRLKKDKKSIDVLFVLSAIFVSVSLPLHLLGDNRQPLDCAFGCDFNTTSLIQGVNIDVEDNCNVIVNSAVRLALIKVTALLLIPISLLLISNGCLERKKNKVGSSSNK